MFIILALNFLQLAFAATQPRKSVFVMRHCARSTPLSGLQNYIHQKYSFYDNYSNATFPKWPVETYMCLKRGLKIVKHVGSLLKTIIPEPVRNVYVDTAATRDNDTATNLLQGLGLNANVNEPSTGENLFVAAPTLFDPSDICAPLSRIARYTATYQSYLQPRPVPSSDLYSKLSAVLGYGVAGDIENIPDQLVLEGSPWNKDFIGRTTIASHITEALLMQWGGGLQVAWGRLKDVPSFIFEQLQTHIYYRGVQNRYPTLVVRSHSYMSRFILNYLTSKEYSNGTIFLVGHDSDLDAIGALFGLEWDAQPYPINATTPNSLLRIDLLKDTDTVEANYYYTTFESTSPSLRKAPANFQRIGEKDSNTVSLADLTSLVMDETVDECVPKELRQGISVQALCIIIVGSIAIVLLMFWFTRKEIYGNKRSATNGQNPAYEQIK